MRTVREGSVGQAVEVLQLALQRAGYETGDIDGIFGTRTHSAVSRFQKNNGLKADGIVGMHTWARLNPYLTGYVTHTVARGETFWQIAERYDASVNAIRVANPSVNPLNLQVGTRIIVPLNFAVVPTDVSYSYELLTYIVEGLAARYPAIRTQVIGASVMGRDLLCLVIGSGRKQVSYNASHHANEWITTPVLLKFAEDLSRANAYNEKIYGINARSLLNDVTLYMIPMVNPDGVDLVTGAITSDDGYYKQARAIAAAYPAIPFPSGWKANIAGTDLNLNYPANWELARETKFAQGYTSPAPRDYVGTEPLSAPESRAMADFTLGKSFVLILAYHTQGRVIYWKYLDYEPRGAYDIALEFADASGYRPELTPSESAYAGYKDWFIQTYNLPGYTIEAGIGDNPLPISQFDTIYSHNLGILVLGMELVK